MLIGEPAEATKLVSEIGDVLDKFFYPLYLYIFSKKYHMSFTSLHGRAPFVAFGRGKVHLIGRIEKYKLALPKFETSAKNNEQLKAYN